MIAPFRREILNEFGIIVGHGGIFDHLEWSAVVVVLLESIGEQRVLLRRHVHRLVAAHVQ